MSAEICAFFVYGTLKKDRLRGGMWPRPPSSIVQAIVQADLFDLGPYPGAVRGENWLLGELWQFDPIDIPVTVEVLDRIEGYEPLRKSNEYVRVVINALVDSGAEQLGIPAYTYLVANSTSLKHARPIRPYLDFQDRQVAAWPDALCRIHASLAEE
jgi:gamma-glutamylcyclotransferase (GGCT)/AIG2-like uncharacterized protein YtfP